jgi:hypothetical protein
MALEVSRTRFVVMGAPTMLDLLASMNEFAHPLSRCIYFGKNEGEYSEHPEIEKINKAMYIAIFDYAPVQTYLIENVQIMSTLDDSDSSSDVQVKDDITMSA